MKKLILFLTTIMLTIGVVAQIKISDLPSTTSINDADLLILVQSGNTRKIDKLHLFQYLNNVTNESKTTMFTSPTFTGIPVAPTAIAGTSTTQIATTAFTTTADNLKADLADPTFTGTPTIPSPFYIGITLVTTTGVRLNLLNAATGTTGTTTTNIVFSESPALTGVPTAPTAAPGINTTQIATTAFATTADNLKLNSADFADSLHARTKIFNVTDPAYGAKGDASNDDTEEIQACLDAASAMTYRATVYFPAGRYKTTATLTATGDGNGYGINLKGEGFASQIYNTGTTATLELSDMGYCNIEDLHFKGTGGNYGVGASGLGAIVLDNVNYTYFRNLYIFNNGGHGIDITTEGWGNIFESCHISHNLYDGIHAVHISDGQASNANALSITDCIIRANGDDGVKWSGADGLNLRGNTIESNLGSGLQIGSSDTFSNTHSAMISGNYFEENDSAQIYLVAQSGFSIGGIVIEGNYINDGGVDATLDALIKHVVNGGTNYYTLYNTTIGKNFYYKAGGTVVYNVQLYRPRSDVKVDISEGFLYTAGDVSTDLYSAVDYLGEVMIKPVSATITTAGITASMFYPEIFFTGTASIDITADPQIADGFNGQTIRIWNFNASYTLTLEDGTGLALQDDITCVLGQYECITLKYYASADRWIEINRSNIDEIIAGKADLNAPIFYNGIITDGLKVGDLASPFIANTDSISVDDAGSPTLFKVFSGATQLIPDVPDAARSILIRTFAGDTANYNTPEFVGQEFLDLTNKDLYKAFEAVRGGWIKINP